MTELIEYDCPNCGAKLKFDPSKQKMTCPYCDSEIDVASLQSLDELLKREKQVTEQSDDWTGAAQTFSEDDQMVMYTCSSCGGEIITDRTTGATSCPFCGNPVVMAHQFSGDFMPDYVIPFKLDKQAAKEGLRQHLKDKPLLPKTLVSEQQIDEIKGIYVPFWLFDAKAEVRGRYRTTRIRGWRDHDFQYTETSHYEVLRAGSLQFKGVPVDASTKMSDALMESLEPFDLSEAVDFQTAYLAGYFADRYDISLAQCQEHAKERMNHSARLALDRTVMGYATSINEDYRMTTSNPQMKYVLYPVWLLNTSWNGQKFQFAMNGQTGKFIGDLPVDKKKYWHYFRQYALIAMLVILIIQIVGILL